MSKYNNKSIEKNIFVRVINKGKVYPSYIEWFRIYAPSLLQAYIDSSSYYTDLEDQVGLVLAKGNHEKSKISLIAVRLKEGSVILIEEGAVSVG